MINDHIIPIGILKKKKLDLNEGENNQKRFCFNQGELGDFRKYYFIFENFRFKYRRNNEKYDIKKC